MDNLDINRIVAHTDFDGLISALFLQELLGVEEVVFTQPQEIQTSRFVVHRTDAVVDLPYPQSGCGMWIDHHSGNRRQSASDSAPHHYYDAKAKSCPSVIFSQYPRANERLAHLLPLALAADKVDSADYSESDLRSPNAAMQIALGIDTGDDSRDDLYRIWLLDQLRQFPLEAVAAMPIVLERFTGAQARTDAMLASIDDVAMLRGNVLLIDLCGKDESRSGLLSFYLYLRYPTCSVTLSVRDSGEAGRVKVSLGENIFNRVNRVDLGGLMRSYGGGGHKVAGGCTIPVAEKEAIIDAMVVVLNENDGSSQ